MDHNIEKEKINYFDDPDELVELCDSIVTDMLISINDSDITQKQAQLIEVSRSIDQLDKLSIGIPDELRNLKISLVTEIEIQLKNRENLEKIFVGFKKIIESINASEFVKDSKKKRRRRRKSGSDLPRTQQDVFRNEIIDAIRSLGGKGTPVEVRKIIEERMKDKFLPGDIDSLSDGRVVWKNRVHWERNNMRNEGILKGDSPRGIWELSEEYK